MAQVQFVTDNFTRANENPLSDGGRWTNVSGLAMQVSSDVATQASGTSGAALFTGISWPRSQYSEIVLGTGDATNANYYFLTVRANGAPGGSLAGNNFCVQAYIPAALGSSGTAFIRVYLNGNYTQMASGTVTPALGDTWRLSAIGNVFTLSQNGTSKVTWTPTVLYPYEGIPGFGVYDANSNPINVTSWAGGGTPDTSVRITLASDNFNRANGGMGTNWTQLIAATPPQILSDLLVTPATGEGISTYTAYTWSAAQWAQITIPTMAATNTNFAGAIVRANTVGSDNDYAVFVYSGILYIQKRLNGAYSSNLVSQSWTPTNGDVYRIEISGTTVTSFANNILVASVTDSSISSGSAGLLIASSTTSSPTISLFAAGFYGLPNPPNSLLLSGVGT